MINVSVVHPIPTLVPYILVIGANLVHQPLVVYQPLVLPVPIIIRKVHPIQILVPLAGAGALELSFPDMRD